MPTRLEPMPGEPPVRPAAQPSGRRHRRRWPWVLLALVAALVAYRVAIRRSEPPPRAGGAAGPMGTGGRPIPVVVSTARQGDLPVYLSGLGTVTAFNTVTVKTRVDGQLVKIGYEEGQFVHQGDLLAEIDPRPFEVQLEQAQGQFARDTAQLRDAKLNLERYRDLVAHDFIPKQQYDDQGAQVQQLEGALKIDQSAIDNAKLQLTYCHITAPISGRVGLRLVDMGNMVHASDATGLAVITQVQPIAVVFTLPEDNLPIVLSKLHHGEQLAVDAYDRAAVSKIAGGTLLTADNQIDPTTGTTRLKAVFTNDDLALFPNQFVNARLRVSIQKSVVIIPVAAVQRGPQGTFVYRVKPDHSVETRTIELGPTAGTETAVASGLAAGDQVVIEGIDKLRPGSLVEARASEPAAAATPNG